MFTLNKSTFRHQFKVPAGLVLSAASLYMLYHANENRKRIQDPISSVKENMKKLKQATEDFKCMPAVQEAQQQAREQKLKWQEGKERFKENQVVFKEAMKHNNKMYQELATTMPDLTERAEKEIDAAWQTLEIVNSDERVDEILLKYPEDAEEFTLMIENCRGSMNRATELLEQEQKSLGWTLLVASELNNLHAQTKKLQTWIDVTEGTE